MNRSSQALARVLLPLLMALGIPLLLLSGCRGPVSDKKQPSASFDLSNYEIRELPIAGGAPIGRLANGSLVIAVFQEKAAYPQGVYVVDPAAGKPAAIVNLDTQRELFDAILTGDILVWVETDRRGAGQRPPGGGGAWRLWARNLVTGKQWEVDYCRLEPNQVLPLGEISASGNRLVWTVFEPGGPAGGRAVLRLYDLTTGATEILDQVDVSLGDLGISAISGHYVVYNPGHIDQKKSAKYGAIVLLDLRTRERETIDEGYRVCAPSMYGRYVVWVSGGTSIMLYDIKTRAARTVVYGGAPEVWYPRVNDKIVVWLSGGGVTVAPVGAPGDASTETPTIYIGPSTGGGAIRGSFLYWHVLREEGGVLTKYIDFSEGK